MATRAKIKAARRLRQRSTAAEKKAWELLRNRRMLGLKFRQQQPVRGFIADFYCAEFRLIIEVDGAIHDRWSQKGYDLERTKILESHNFTVLRIRNEDVSEANLRRLLFPLSRSPREGARV